MKTLKIFAAMLMVAAALVSCNKEPKTPSIVDVETHYDMVYMLGGAAFDAEGNSHWDAADPIAMNATSNPDEFEVEIDLVRSAENKLIKFVLSNDKPWNEATFLVPAVEAMVPDMSYAYLKEGLNKLAPTSEPADGEGNLRDHFFGMEKGTSGRYKLVVNPVEFTVHATKLSSLAEPEIIEWQEGMLYLVGDLNGWQIANPIPMVKESDKIFTFEGEIKSGTMKIATIFDWSGAFYRPAVDGVEISQSGIANNAVVCGTDEEVGGDYKWSIVDTGKYKLTLDIEAMTMEATWLGE